MVVMGLYFASGHINYLTVSHFLYMIELFSLLTFDPNNTGQTGPS